MKIEELQEWEQRREAIELVSTLLQEVPLSKQGIAYEIPEEEAYDYLAYIPWIVEDFPHYHKEILASHIHAYLKEE